MIPPSHSRISRRWSVAIVTLATFLSPGALSQEPQDTQIGDWLLRCAGPEDSPDQTCLMATTATIPLEQRDIAILQIIRVAPSERQGEEEFAAQLTSPTNVNVRAGIDFQVDQNSIISVPYEVCMVNNCITSFALTSELIALMRNGFAASLTFTNASGQTFSGALSLDGFGPALDEL